MVIRKKPYLPSRNDDDNEMGSRTISFRVPPMVDITDEESEVEASRSIASYLLHHVGSDRHVPGETYSLSG